MAEPSEDPSGLPIFLKKSPEIASLDHKKSSSEQTAATDVSPMLASDPTESKLKAIPIIHNSLFFERFTCPVPEHFICLVCSNIVKDPRECSLCENLFCLLCIKTIGTCPMGCLDSNFNQIAKFALKTYNSLSLVCKNHAFGCNFEGILERVLEHESKCEFFVVQCENSLCDRLIYCPPMQDSDCPLLCSELCETMIKFSVLINEENISESLNVFTSFFERCKKLAELEVKEELQEKLRKIEENKRIYENFRRQKERIEKEIISRQSTYHPGKWNLKTLKWTCCGIVDVASIGCQHIGGAKSVNLSKCHRIRSTRPQEITKSDLNQIDTSCLKLEPRPICRPPTGMNQRRYSFNRNTKRISALDRSRRSDSNQENLKENPILVRKYEIPDKRPVVRRRNTQAVIKKVFNMTQTDLSDEEIKTDS